MVWGKVKEAAAEVEEGIMHREAAAEVGEGYNAP